MEGSRARLPSRPSLPERSFETSLGPVAERHGDVWRLDLTGLPLFRGLSGLSRILGDRLLEHARTDQIDVSVDLVVQPRENPELREVLGVAAVRICAEREVVDPIVRHPTQFHDHLRALFGTLQRRGYREALFPPEGGLSRALVFTFPLVDEGPSLRYRFVLERLVSAAGGHSFLRVTIEDPEGRRLDLASLPHIAVEDLGRRTFIAGSTRIGQSWAEGLRREAERGRRSYVETRKPYSYVFAQFRKGGLDRIEQVALSWNDALAPRILESDPEGLQQVLKRILLALEDQGIRTVLDAGGTVVVRCADLDAYLDQSQLGRVLHMSLGQPRRRTDIGAFLDRMPATRRVTDEAAPALPLSGVRVFLVHHLTAEVLGLVAALRRLGCRDLVTVFVAYAGEVPGSYLGPLLDLPSDECQFLGLTHVPDPGSVEGCYQLASHFSPLEGREELAGALREGRLGFFEAMQTVTGHEFLRQLQRAEACGERCLLIEDGGYLAPLLARAALEGWPARRLASELGAEHEDDRPLATRLADRLIGTVEHTRNGHDRLAQIEERDGRLASPAFSIAISRLKVEEEAGEVAASLLNAVENVLHCCGRVLGRRRCLVLGSRGAIGSHLVRQLGHRLAHVGRQLSGVDLRATFAPGAEPRPVEARSYRGLPRQTRRQLDLVLGVTGASVLSGADITEWLLEGDAPELMLASGSTKTVEFDAVARWLNALLEVPSPAVGGFPARLHSEAVTDPLTGRVYGHRYRFDIATGAGERQRDLLLLAALTPVNFMFYGVPTEAIDGVIAQLLGCALGLRQQAGALPPRLYAVDRDITPAGLPLATKAEAV